MLSNFTFLNTIKRAICEHDKLPYTTIHLCGGRKSGKTYSVVELLVDCLFLKEKIISYAFRKYTADIRKSIFAEVLSQLKQRGLYNVVKIAYQQQIISYKNNKIIFLGLYKQNKELVQLQGLYRENCDYAIKWFEERYEYNNNDIHSANEAIGGYQHAIVVNSCNPWSLKNEYISYCQNNIPYNLTTLQTAGEQFGIKDNELFYYNNYQLNSHLSNDEITGIENVIKINYERAKVVAWGFYGLEQGSIYAPYLSKSTSLLNYDDYTTFIGGLDVGTRNDALACVIGALIDDKKQLHILEEFYYDFKKQPFIDPMQSANLICRWLKDLSRKYPYLTHFNLVIYCDNDYSYISWLNEYKFHHQLEWVTFERVRKIRIRHRIDFLTTLLASGKCGLQEERTPALYNELVQSNWDAINPEQRKDSNDHAINALEYAFNSVIEQFNFIL